MNDLLNAFKYSYKYMLIIVISYFLLNLSYFYRLNIVMIAIVPLNFLALKYGLFKELNKDHYATKYYILMELVIVTTLFNSIFLSIVKTHFLVIIFVVIINSMELIFLDTPQKK
ncbi:MAG: hypothetical protein RR659_00295 [Bacilli bacterium]